MNHAQHSTNLVKKKWKIDDGDINNDNNDDEDNRD